MDSILILMDMWGFNLLPHWYSPRHKQYIYTMFTLLAFSFPITKVGACFSTNHSNVKRKTILWLWILWIPLDQIAWQAVVFSFILLLCSTSILVVKLKKEILDLSFYVTLIEKIHPLVITQVYSPIYNVQTCMKMWDTFFYWS